MGQAAREYDELPDELENFDTSEPLDTLPELTASRKDFLSTFSRIFPINISPDKIVEATNDARLHERKKVTAILHLDQ